MKKKLFIACIVAITLASCNSENKGEHSEESHEEHGVEVEGAVILNKSQQEALDLKLGQIQLRNLTTVIKTNGQLSVAPNNNADVTAFIGGNVKEINVFSGDKVKKGQLLATLEHPDFISLQEDFSEISNKLKFLEQEYTRQKELFENNVGSGKDYQSVKSEYTTAKVRYQGLKYRLELLNISTSNVENGIISKTVNILSPINGYITEVGIKIGTYVDAGNVLFSIYDNSEIHADFLIYEKDVPFVKVGQKVDFTVSNSISQEYTATVFAVGKEFEENSRAVHVHATITNKNEALIPGMYISGHIHADENYTQTLLNDAIVIEGTKSYIFIVDNSVLANVEEGKYEEHEGHKEHGDDDGHEEHEEKSEGEMAFKMIEVITGKSDEGYTEVKLIKPLPSDTQIVLNSAYYLIADMKKEETEHDH